FFFLPHRGKNGMCNYPVSNIQYPLFNDGGANWILAVGYWVFAHSTPFPVFPPQKFPRNHLKKKKKKKKLCALGVSASLR
ncbi:MAG: hypothetical protein II909_00430, partial [Kiritimatiellae bacterium]|nr:hypothetical protein [Kiritimatiellia bacterium]